MAKIRDGCSGAVDEIFEDLSVFPLFGVSAILDEHWRVDVLLPKEAQLSYSFDGDKVIGFLRVDLDGALYAVRDRVGPSKVVEDLNIQELRASIGASYRMTRLFSLTVEVGAILAGQHELRNGAGVVADGHAEPAPFASVSVGVSF